VILLHSRVAPGTVRRFVYLSASGSDPVGLSLNEKTCVSVRRLAYRIRDEYGWPRIWRELIRRGIRVGKQRVQRMMQKHGIRALGKRRFRVTTTDSRYNLPIAPNLLNRNFTPGAPNEAWSGDITYIATEEGWLFLAVVIDLFSRKVVGWSMRPDMHRSLVIDALEMGLFQRRRQKGQMISHSG
jgi:putative transposase